MKSTQDPVSVSNKSQFSLRLRAQRKVSLRASWRGKIKTQFISSSKYSENNTPEELIGLSFWNEIVQYRPAICHQIQFRKSISLWWPHGYSWSIWLMVWFIPRGGSRTQLLSVIPAWCRTTKFLWLVLKRKMQNLRIRI